jgi:hypothetical protein
MIELTLRLTIDQLTSVAALLQTFNTDIEDTVTQEEMDALPIEVMAPNLQKSFQSKLEVLDIGYDARKTIPWDERIHASSKSKNADQTWRYKKGVDRITLVPQVEAELLGKTPELETHLDEPPPGFLFQDNPMIPEVMDVMDDEPEVMDVMDDEPEVMDVMDDEPEVMDVMDDEPEALPPVVHIDRVVSFAELIGAINNSALNDHSTKLFLQGFGFTNVMHFMGANNDVRVKAMEALGK